MPRGFSGSNVPALTDAVSPRCISAAHPWRGKNLADVLAEAKRAWCSTHTQAGLKLGPEQVEGVAAKIREI